MNFGPAEAVGRPCGEMLWNDPTRDGMRKAVVRSCLHLAWLNLQKRTDTLKKVLGPQVDPATPRRVKQNRLHVRRN